MAIKLDPQDEDDRYSIWRAAGAVIDDPTSVPGLSSRVEADAIPKSGVPFDTTKTTGVKVDCALCGRARNHNRGFVVTIEDDRRAIIGRNCGEEHLFAKGAWEDMAAASERRKYQVLYAARSAPTIAAIDRLIPLLHACQRGVATLDQFASLIGDELPELYDGIAGSAKHGGQLIRHIEKKVPQIGRDGELREGWTTERRAYVTVATIGPFVPGGIGVKLGQLSKSLQRVRALLDREGVTLQEQGAAFQSLRSLSQDFRQVQDDAEKAKAFLSHSLWEKVAKWAQADPDREGNYRLKQRGGRWILRHSEGDELIGEAEIPTESDLDLSALAAVRSEWPRSS